MTYFEFLKLLFRIVRGQYEEITRQERILDELASDISEFLARYKDGTVASEDAGD